MLSRVIYGTRVSLSVAFVAATVSLLVGIAYGTVSGYAGGWADNAMMRVVDFLYGIPVLIVVILMQVFFKAVARREGVSGIMAPLISIDQSMGGLSLRCPRTLQLDRYGPYRPGPGAVL